MTMGEAMLAPVAVPPVPAPVTFLSSDVIWHTAEALVTLVIADIKFDETAVWAEKNVRPDNGKNKNQYKLELPFLTQINGTHVVQEHVCL